MPTWPTGGHRAETIDEKLTPAHTGDPLANNAYRCRLRDHTHTHARTVPDHTRTVAMISGQQFSPPAAHESCMRTTGGRRPPGPPPSPLPTANHLQPIPISQISTPTADVRRGLRQPKIHITRTEILLRSPMLARYRLLYITRSI